MVESCFGSSGEQLLIPGRVLVGEGVLTKMCRKRPKPRQFFLFNDILVYGNIIIGKKKYNKQHIIPLEEVQLQGLDDTPRELSKLFAFMSSPTIVWHFHRFLPRYSIRHTQRLADKDDGKVIRGLCCDKHGEAGMDGAYQQMHRRFVTQKWESRALLEECSRKLFFETNREQTLTSDSNARTQKKNISASFCRRQKTFRPTRRRLGAG